MKGRITSNLQNTQLRPWVQQGYYDLHDSTENIIDPPIWNTYIQPGMSVVMRMRNAPTPLHEAILRGNEEIARILLRHGADPRSRVTNGLSALEVAEEMSPTIAEVIKTGVHVDGPVIHPSTSRNPVVKPTASPRRAPPRGSAKWQACKTFQATVINFSLENRETRVTESILMLDLLYGKGVSAQPPHTITWYHIPANNVCTSFPIIHLLHLC